MQKNDTFETSFEQFLSDYPSYLQTSLLDELRKTEYSRLDEQGHVYLDYTGGGLYATSQLQKHIELLGHNVYGNPHSSNPTSLAMTHLVEQARRAALDFFNASPDEYVAIFTSNASGALKLVGESFPFTKNDHYLLTFDNHNSVNGIREFARSHGAEITYIPLHLPDLRVDETQLDEYLDLARPGGNNLFAFPAQSNFSSVQHPLTWIEKAHKKGWSVLVDCAAFAPTNLLDLSVWKPDFIPLSFYKIFGYPTGVGCLIAKREALANLHRPWFAGGTITVASIQGDKYYLAPGEAAFEEGTLNYLTLPAIEIGLDHIRSIGLDTIHNRVHCLTGWLVEHLADLRYPNGNSLAQIYGPLTSEARGGAMALNFSDCDGNPIDHQLVEQKANKRNISLRTGCFCNPGAGEMALQLSKPELVACFTNRDERLSLDEFRTCIDNKRSGAVRISVGLASNFKDVYRFVEFAKEMMEEG